MEKRKTSRMLLFTLAGLGLLTTSCQKDHVYDPTKVKHTSELEVPAGFTWNTTRNVEFAVSSPVTTVAKIYSDKSCTEANILASFPVSQTATDLNLEVPVSTQEVYLQYPTEAGNKIQTITVPQLVTKASLEVILPEDAIYPDRESDFDNRLLRITNHWKLMFEDNWPEKGDYDFNDFVIDYSIRTDYSLGHSQDDTDLSIYKEEGVTVTVKFMAIGGILPYHLGLQLDGTPSKYIDNTDLPKTVNGITVSLQNPNSDDPAVFIFEGTENLKGQEGAKYFNTESNHAVTPINLPEISFRLNINSYNNLSKAMALTSTAYTQNHNFFLQLKENGGKEIHLRGYEPTPYYKNYAEDAKDLMSSTISYYSKDNFVWGFKVPSETPHAIETVDFKEAYINFAAWVISGGTEQTNWFKAAFRNPDKLMQ